jgi:hypothetical protein
MNHLKLTIMLSIANIFVYADQIAPSTVPPAGKPPLSQHPTTQNKTPNQSLHQKQRPHITEAKKNEIHDIGKTLRSDKQYNKVPAGTYTVAEAQDAIVKAETAEYMKLHPDADPNEVLLNFQREMELDGGPLEKFMGVQFDPKASIIIEHPTEDSTTVTTKTIKTTRTTSGLTLPAGVSVTLNLGTNDQAITMELPQTAQPTPIPGTNIVVPAKTSLSFYKNADIEAVSFSNAQGQVLKISTPVTTDASETKTVTVYQSITLPDGTIILPGTYDQKNPSIIETIPPTINETP